MTNSPIRTAKEVIDQALQENAGSKVLCYGIACSVVLAGLVVLLWGAYHLQGIVALSGALASGLFWPALHYAREIRKENITIRLFEVPLANATTADSSAKLLVKLLKDAFGAKAKGREE